MIVSSQADSLPKELSVPQTAIFRRPRRDDTRCRCQRHELDKNEEDSEDDGEDSGEEGGEHRYERLQQVQPPHWQG